MVYHDSTTQITDLDQVESSEIKKLVLYPLIRGANDSLPELVTHFEDPSLMTMIILSSQIIFCINFLSIFTTKEV